MTGPNDRNGDETGFEDDSGMSDVEWVATSSTTLGEPEELALTNEDEPLPWLESADYDQDNSADTGRIVGLLLLGLIVVGALIAAIWALSRPDTDPQLVADGSVIEAPEGDYKTRPDDAGGSEVAGTGDNSFAVGEGERREGQIASGNASQPSVATQSTTGAQDDEETSTAASGATATNSGGVGVQVGAYSDKETANAGWGKLRSQTDALNGFNYRVVEGKADIGTVYRLQAVAGDAAAADKLCAALKSDGVACQVKR